MKVIEGAFAAPNAQVAIVISRFNSFINEVCWMVLLMR